MNNRESGGCWKNPEWQKEETKRETEEEGMEETKRETEEEGMEEEMEKEEMEETEEEMLEEMLEEEMEETKREIEEERMEEDMEKEETEMEGTGGDGGGDGGEEGHGEDRGEMEEMKEEMEEVEEKVEMGDEMDKRDKEGRGRKGGREIGTWRGQREKRGSFNKQGLLGLWPGSTVEDGACGPGWSVQAGLYSPVVWGSFPAGVSRGRTDPAWCSCLL